MAREYFWKSVFLASIVSLFFLGVANINAAAQAADQVLVKVVDQFSETVGQTGTGSTADNGTSTFAHLFPFGPKFIEDWTDTEYQRIHDTNDVPLLAEDRRTRKSFANGRLENYAPDWFWPKKCLLSHPIRNSSFEENEPHSWPSWENRNCVSGFNFIPTSESEVRQVRSLNLKEGEIEVGHVVGDGDIDRFGWIQLPINNNGEICGVLFPLGLSSSDNMVGGKNHAIRRNDKAVSTEFVPYTNLYDSTSIRFENLPTGQTFLGVCAERGDTYCDKQQYFLHGTSPYVEVNDAMLGIACFDCKLTSSAGEAH
jgi:hypothetical protein